MEGPVSREAASPPAHSPAPTLPPDIPLALLEYLSKGPMTQSERMQQQQQANQQQSSLSGGPTPGRLLQQSQYANLLLERQIQVLQREQAKLLLVREAVALQQEQEQRQLAQLQQRQSNDEHRLRHLMDIKTAAIGEQQQKKARGPTNHRASAA